MALDVFLGNDLIGRLSRDGTGCELRYINGLEGGDGAALPLSLSLPIRPEPYGAEETRPFLDGLLPTDEWREDVAEALGLDADDTYGLLAELGRDCPGAVVFVPEGEEPPSAEAPPAASLTDEDFAFFFEEGVPLPDADDPVEMRVALPGDRPMVTLAKDGEGWSWPTATRPSTHLLVTEVGEMPQYATNLMACTEVMRRRGIPLAQAELLTVGGQRCLLVERVDRSVSGDRVERVHLETFNQALGVAPDAEEALNASHAGAVALLQELGEERAVEDILAFAVCNYVFGNDESVHGHLAALLYADDGPTLAPFYPIASEGASLQPTCKDDERSLVMAMRKAEEIPALLPDPIRCDPELMPLLVGALKKASRLRRTVREISQEARAAGWHTRIVDLIPPYTRPRSTFFTHPDDFFDL